MIIFSLFIVVLGILLLALLLFLIAKSLGGQGVSYVKALGAICVWSISSFILSKFLFSLLSFILSLVVFCLLVKKFFQLSWGKAILVYFGQFIGIIILALILRFTILMPFVEPVTVNGNSMEPLYPSGSYLLANKIDKNYKRGDIVVYIPPAESYLNSSNQRYIHRIVGLPGETIQTTQEGKVIIDRKAFNEDYIKTGTPLPNAPVGKLVTLASDEYYVLCDNRQGACLDSRAFGPIKATSIIGKIWYQVY